MYLKRNSSNGFALAEMIISLAAVTLAIALVAGLGQQVMQLARSSKQTAAVVELRSKTTAITRNLDSWIGKLRSSPHTGATFSACIPDPSTPVSVFKCPDVNADILNNDAELKRIAGTQLHAASVNVVDMLGEKLAGTIDSPVLYDLDGRICTSNCALKATGFLLRSNPANDSTPGSVKFVVKVEPHSRTKGQSPIRTSYLSIDVGSEWQQPSGLCPSGSIKVGYLSNGKPSCINPTKKCAANTVHLGLDGSGNPICKTPPVSCATAGGNVVINAEGTDLVCATNLQSAVPCQSNEIFLGYYAGTGVPMCSSTNLSCPDGQVQIGIAQQGSSLTAQCKTLPSCQDSQKLSYDGSQFVCKSASVASVCNPGEVVVGINDDGSAKCEIQERNLASTELTCPTGKYVSGLEPSGKVICSDLPSTNVTAPPSITPPGVPSSGQSGALSCRTVSSQSGQAPTSFCSIGETRTGGGCQNVNGGAYFFLTHPIVANDGRQGWQCGSGSTGTLSIAHSICCSGGGGQSTNSQLKTFVSNELDIPTVSAAATVLVNHNLGTTPHIVKWVLVNKIAQFGYSVGEEVDLMSTSNTAGQEYHSRSYFQNNTQLGISWWHPASYNIRAVGKTINNTMGENFQSPNWKIKVYAYAYQENPTPVSSGLSRWPNMIQCSGGGTTIFPQLHSVGVNVEGGSSEASYINYNYTAREGGNLLLTYNKDTGAFIKIIGQYGQGNAPGVAAESCKRNMLQ